MHHEPAPVLHLNLPVEDHREPVFGGVGLPPRVHAVNQQPVVIIKLFKLFQVQVISYMIFL